MFFRKKKQEENAEALRQLETDINQIGQTLETFKEELKEELRQGRKEEEKWLRRQSESFEDLLEEMQEEKESRNAERRLLQEAEQREQALLAMVCCGREQLELLERQITKDGAMSGDKREAWSRQFEVMRRETQKYMRSCGMEEVGNVGEPLDYDIHEVLSLTETKEEGKAGTVAEVFSCGMIYRGRLMKKAQVAAYRMNQEEERQVEYR